MKLSTLALLLAAAAGCSKTSDLGPIREGANQLIARTTPELDEAAKHLADLGNKVPPTAVAAVNDAMQLIGNARSELAATKQQLDAAEKTGNPEEMEKISDELSEKVERVRTAISVDINTIDALVYEDASWPKPVVAQLTPPAPAPGTTEGTTPTPEAPRGDTEGHANPAEGTAPTTAPPAAATTPNGPGPGAAGGSAGSTR